MVNVKFPTGFLHELRDRYGRSIELGLDADDLCQQYANIIERATDIVLVFWSALKSHFPEEEWAKAKSDLAFSVLQWMPLVNQDQTWISVAKFHLSWIFARYEDQEELPEEPSENYWKEGRLLAGDIGYRFILRAKGYRRRARIWRNTILHGIKKGLPQMSDDLVKRACHKMVGRLQKEDTTPDWMLEEIERTAYEIFGKILYEEVEDFKPWTSVSTNACYDNGRASGGNLGYIRDRFNDKLSTCLGFEQLSSMGYFPRRNEVRELYWPSWLWDDEVKTMRWEALNKFEECGKAQVAAILEPLKVRLITAGDTWSNGLWSNLQKVLWKKLQSFEQFALTGRWVTTDDLWDIHVRSPEELTLWNSGDFSAATDSLFADATAACSNQVAGDLIIQNILRKGLTGTKISFEKLAKKSKGEPGGWPEDFVMKSGQLMGSVFSFPFLCCINLAVYRKTYEDYFKVERRISDLPVRINGDDILFKTNLEFQKAWETNIKLVGFCKSVGKNYVSARTAVINSTYFDVTSGFDPVALPYFNMGWCTGVMKGGKSSESPLRLRAIADELEAYWRGGDHERVKTFKEEIYNWNHEEIESCGLPLDRGPLGLNLGLKDEFFKIKDQFRWFCLKRIEKKRLPGFKEISKSVAPWKVAMWGSQDDTNFLGLQAAFKGEKQKLSRYLTRRGLDQALGFSQYHVRNGANHVAGLVRGFFKQNSEAIFHFGSL